MSEKRQYNEEYEVWRRAVLNKYGSKCVICGSYKQLHAHHIKPWKDFPELRFLVENGEILCFSCHLNKHPFMEKYYKLQEKTYYEKLFKRHKVKENVLIVNKNKVKINKINIKRCKKLRMKNLRSYNNYRFTIDNPNPNWTS